MGPFCKSFRCSVSLAQICQVSCRGERRLRLDVRVCSFGHREVCYPICLVDLQSDNAHAFLIVVKVASLSRTMAVLSRIQFVSIADFFKFLFKVGTRQKRKIGTVLVFPFVGFCNFAFLPHASC